MSPIIKTINDKNIKTFVTNGNFDIKDLGIHPINVFHDALEPVGYILFNEHKKISIITDTGWVNDKIVDEIRESNLYYIESNHDVTMLIQGSYPHVLKQRIMSTHGHLSNVDAGSVLASVLSGTGEVVLLAHLSKDNNTPELAYKTVKRKYSESGARCRS